MEDNQLLPLQGIEEHDVLTSILAGTASTTGEEFFTALVEGLSSALHTHLAWVTEYLPESKKLRVLSFWSCNDEQFPDQYPLAGTPCEPVVLGSKLVHIPDDFAMAYPQDLGLIRLGVSSYLGVPLLDLDGTVLGHLAVMDAQAMPAEPRFLAIFRIFAARAAAELQRLRTEAEVRDHEEKLTHLISGAMDAIVEIDEHGNIVLLNKAAELLLDASQADVGQSFVKHLDNESSQRLKGHMKELAKSNVLPASLWIPGGLTTTTSGDDLPPTEVTLSAFTIKKMRYYVLIMRDVRARLEAEQRIQSLSHETSYLREEINQLGNFGGILGASPAMKSVIADLNSVAKTDASVLVLGESGTGKELIARAVHEASPRAENTLVKLNCAALPEHLVEAELFGHEKGAFTGATQKREGRFALADGGTIFLDEIGDLPLPLQSKLLRVLQEGEFEPLGSSVTRKVDVRVIAATNQDLHLATEEGRFREDLYYRLAVFPITLPPLRQRLEDLRPLCEAFIQTFSARLGHEPLELTESDLERLVAYDWPGNIRELQNVVERGLITATDGRLNLDRALPKFNSRADTVPIKTMAELVALECDVIRRALAETGWQVSGDGGAAQLLGMNASTLNSRMKALSINRK